MTIYSPQSLTISPLKRLSDNAEEENNAEEEFEPSSATYSDYEQKQFALKSTEFNVKSRVFNKFFPDLKQET